MSAHSESRKGDNAGYENISKQMSERSAHSESRKGSKEMSERSAHSESRKGSKQMSERSAHSVSRKLVSKQMSDRSAHSVSRKVSKQMSAHSESRKDNDVGCEKRSKQRSAHSESRKDDGDEYDKSSKQMSEDSQAEKYEYEKRSKRKHDDEFMAESEHVSNTVGRQESPKEQQSYKSTPKEKETDEHEVSKTSKVNLQSYKSTRKEKEAQASKTSQDAAEEVSGSKKPTKRTQFVRIFTYKDDKRILKALHKTGYTTGTKPFWDSIGHTLELSIQADQKQLYSKVRRLRRDYLKGYKETSSKKERKLYHLSDKIWNEEAKAAPVRKKAKQTQEVLSVHAEDNYDVKLEKFVRGLHNEVKFPVAESLEVVDASKRSTLQKKWNDLNGYMFKLYITKIDLIRETMEAVGSSPDD